MKKLLKSKTRMGLLGWVWLMCFSVGVCVWGRYFGPLDELTSPLNRGTDTPERYPIFPQAPSNARSPFNRPDGHLEIRKSIRLKITRCSPHSHGHLPSSLLIYKLKGICQTPRQEPNLSLPPDTWVSALRRRARWDISFVLACSQVTLWCWCLLFITWKGKYVCDELRMDMKWMTVLRLREFPGANV